MPIPIHAGLAGLAKVHDGFILDLWGVVHDGRRPYPGAVACMLRLRAAGKPVLLLSNAPRAGDRVAEFLDGLGVPREGYDHLLTSGDLTRAALAARAPGRRYLHIGPERDFGLLDGLDCEKTAEPEAAEFLLCTGLYDDEADRLEDYVGLLREAAARHLPMVCANPDLTVMRGPKVIACAGSLARLYEDEGGRVDYYGKPHPAAYDACRAWFGPGMRLLAVGDSLRTDIAGANAAGIDSLLVTGGIHAEELGLKPGQAPDPARLEAACHAVGAIPSGAMAELRW